MSHRFACNSCAFLSGCFPVALINFLHIFPFQSGTPDFWVELFAAGFLLVTIIASICFYRILQMTFHTASTICRITNLKRTNIFSSGAISYYTLPFISFVGNNVQSAITLFVMVIVLLVIFNNNMMFMYTPLFDFLGYKVLDGDIFFPDEENMRHANIVVKTDGGLYFSRSNEGFVEKVNEDTFFFMASGV